MTFHHAEEIWLEFPQLVAGVFAATAFERASEVSAALQPWYARARERLTGQSEGELAEVAAWRRVYSRMGLKPTQYRSAAEALLRRFRREGSLPLVHPLVDLCNAISLAFALPVAVFDLDRIHGSMVVRRARGDESYEGFGGEQEHPAPGEVIFVDESGNVHARRWTFRQSRLSTVGDCTAQVLIVSEGMHDAAPADVPAVLEALRGEIAAAGGEAGLARILTAAEPLFEV